MGLFVPIKTSRLTVISKTAVQRPVVLACDTSTKVGSIALLEGDVITAESMLLSDGNSHSRRILDDIAHMLQSRKMTPADIDLIVSSVGPGSFTGVRIAMASMKGLALSLNRPMVGVSSLLALATPHLGKTAPVMAALDAKKNEVYAAFYDSSGNELIAPTISSPNEFANQVASICSTGPVLAVGEGITAWRQAFLAALPQRITFAAAHENYVKAAVMAVLGSKLPHADVATLEPMYLRRSEAEIKLQKKR